MIAISIASLVFLFCDQTEGLSAAELMQKRWDISDAEIEYNDLEFILNFEVSDMIEDNMIGYTLYDGAGCGDTGENVISENADFVLARSRTDNTPVGDGTGTRTVKIENQIVPSKITNASIFSEDESGNGVVEYCVRFGVWSWDKNAPDSYEVNFRETVLNIVINLTAGVNVDTSLSKVETLFKNVQAGSEVEAYICDSDRNVIAITATMQGQTVRLCITPTQKTLNAGIFMRDLEQFTFRRQDPSSIQQVAIAAGTGGQPADPLTVVSCIPGAIVCAFETMLQADFFSSEGTVMGIGSVFLQVGDGDSSTERRLGEGDSSTDKLNTPQSFIMSFDLVATENTMSALRTSSASITGIASICTSMLMATGLVLSTVAML